MANYIGWILTNKGRELLAKAINNETKINVTKFKIGAGYNTGNDRELTDLLDKRNEFPVNSYERKENGIVEFTFIVSNKTGTGESTITNSYKISEMGIYAQDDSGTEILYAYNKGTDGDYIPVYNGKNAIDIVEKCIIIIDQAATLNVTIDNSMTYLTRDSADRRYLEIQALAKIIGLEFGGNIQDAGAKTTGKFYYDKALKYYYECIANNSLTYNDGSKFRAISNKPLSDKVENLCKIEGESILKIGNLIIQFGVGETSRNGSVNRLSNDFKKIISVVCIHSGASSKSITAVINSANTFTSYFDWLNNDVKGMNYIAIGVSK
nr:MAG TPA: tail collar fiber protein [Caudoviricetes sp.]